MNDDPIADERDLSLPDDSRGQEVEVVRLVPHHNSVASVVAALNKADMRLHVQVNHNLNWRILHDRVLRVGNSMLSARTKNLPRLNTLN